MTEKRESGNLALVKTTVDLPDPIYRRAKAKAAERGISLKTFITDAVESSLAVPTRSWATVLASLPELPADLLKAVAARVAEADAYDVATQKSSSP